MSSEWFTQRIPLLYVLLSTLFFSTQKLILKRMTEAGSHDISYSSVAAQGLFNIIFSITAMLYDGTFREVKSFIGPTPILRWYLLGRSLCGFIGLSFGLIAVENLPVGDATVLIMTSPTFATLAAYFVLKEKFGRIEFISTILSLVGACLVVKPSFLFGEGGNTMGYIYGLLGGITMGFGYVFIRMLGKEGILWPTVNFVSGFVFIVGSFIASYTKPIVLTELTSNEIGLLFLTGFLGAVNIIFMTMGMLREKAVKTTAMRMFDIVFAFLFQATMTSDSVSFISVVGAILVVSSVLLVLMIHDNLEPDIPLDPVEVYGLSQVKIEDYVDHKIKSIP